MPICTNTAFQAAACYGYVCINPRQRQAIQMRLLMLQLAALGGADYTNDLASLNEEVATLRQLTPEQQAAALTNIYAQNAVEAGATVPDVNQLLQDSVAYMGLQDNLDLFLLLLTCKLGVHAEQ